MKFIDEVDICVSSGKGGDGCISFRREKFTAKGGPDGGDGGMGGSVHAEAHRRVNTLVHYRGIKNYLAQDGASGAGRQKNGKAGQDLVLKVPVGTTIRFQEGHQVIADLLEDGQKILIARGGRGGRGNLSFKSSTNQTPRYSQEGVPRTQLKLHLELKLLADLALVGMPNAGKSTLISAISSARPKIADYPFTTLEPHLGVVKMGEQSLVVADVPGLVEMASQGRGLGTKFLKHIERTQALIHLVDISWCLEEYEAFEQYVTIREELAKYGRELDQKRELICLTKVDAITDEEIIKYQQYFVRQLKKKVLPISAVSGKNINILKSLMMKMIQVAH